MITFASTPKPFIGHIGVIQRNAIRSWLQLQPRPQVILFGNEEGTAAVAAELGIEHVPVVASNEFGTPYVSDVFRLLEEKAKTDILCYSNCDIILFPDFAKAAERVRGHFSQFLLVGECTNLDVREPIEFSSDWEGRLRSIMNEKGKRRGVNADFFVFTRGLYPHVPALVLGRAYFDNWIMWEARRLHIPFVDGTGQITAIHQNHYYAVVPGETAQSHNGVEAFKNLDILGGKSRAYWITDHTHRLTSAGIRRDWAATLLLKRWSHAIVKKAKYIILDTLTALGLRR